MADILSHYATAEKEEHCVKTLHLKDNGKQFSNRLWSDTLTQHGTQPVLTAIRGPQGNLAERVTESSVDCFIYTIVNGTIVRCTIYNSLRAVYK